MRDGHSEGCQVERDLSDSEDETKLLEAEDAEAGRTGLACRSVCRSCAGAEAASLELTQVDLCDPLRSQILRHILTLHHRPGSRLEKAG